MSRQDLIWSNSRFLNTSAGKKYLYTFQPLSGRLDTVAFPAEAGAQPSTTTYKNLYNLSGQLVAKNYTAGGPGVTFAYNDFMGRQASMTDWVGTTSYTYVPIASGIEKGQDRMALT